MSCELAFFCPSQLLHSVLAPARAKDTNEAARKAGKTVHEIANKTEKAAKEAGKEVKEAAREAREGWKEGDHKEPAKK